MTINKSMSLQDATAKVSDPIFQMYAIWKYIVKPIAIGGMLMGGFHAF